MNRKINYIDFQRSWLYLPLRQSQTLFLPFSLNVRLRPASHKRHFMFAVHGQLKPDNGNHSREGARKCARQGRCRICTFGGFSSKIVIFHCMEEFYIQSEDLNQSLQTSNDPPQDAFVFFVFLCRVGLRMCFKSHLNRILSTRTCTLSLFPATVLLPRMKY